MARHLRLFGIPPKIFALLVLALILGATHNWKALAQTPADPDPEPEPDDNGDDGFNDDNNEDENQNEDEDEEEDDFDDYNKGPLMIKDLWRLDPYLIEQAQTFTATGGLTQNVTTTICNNARFLGGPGSLNLSGSFEYTYQNLEEHSAIYLSVTVAFFGSWSAPDSFNVIVGDETLNLTFPTAAPPWPTTSCDSTSTVKLTARVKHQGEELLLRFSKVTADQTSQFGVRDIQILLPNTGPKMTASQWFCYNNPRWGARKNCSVPLGSYNDTTTNTIKVCHESCGSCLGPGKDDCTSCKAGFGYDPDYECIKCDASCSTCFGTEPEECSTCPDGMYMHTDFTCQPTCDAIKADYAGDLYCNLCTEDNTPEYDTEAEDPVWPSVLFYYPDDETCKTTCPDPYVSKKGTNVSTCVIPLNKAAVAEVKEMSGDASSAADAMNVGVSAVAVVDCADPGGISAGALAKMLEYTRYFDVTRSARLEVFYKDRRSVPGTVLIGPKMTNDTQKVVQNRKLPKIFMRYNLHSSFLVNFWDSLMTLLIVSAIVLFLLFLELIVVKKYVAKHQPVSRKIRVAAQGFLTMQFYNVYAEMVLFSVLDFRSTKDGDGVNWVGFALSCVFTFLAIFILWRHYKVVKRYQEVKKKASEAPPEEGAKQIEEFHKENDAVQMLYQDFKDYSFMQQSYLLLLTIRNALCSLVISLLFAHPIAQISLVTFLNVLTIFYLAFKAPFKFIFNVFQQIAFELDLLVVNICFLTMACLDVTAPGKQSAKHRNALGDAIMMAVFITKFIPLITLIPKVIMAIIAIRKIIKDKKAAKAAAQAEKNTAADPEAAQLVSPKDIDVASQQQDSPLKTGDRKESYLVQDELAKPETVRGKGVIEDAPPQVGSSGPKEKDTACPNEVVIETTKKDRSVSYLEEDFDDAPGINPIMQLQVRTQMTKN